MRLIIIVIFLSTISLDVLQAQNVSSSVYLLNGEVYRGEVIAIGSESLLMKKDEQIISLDRNRIRYVFGPEKKYQPIRSSQPSPFKRFDKKLSTELGFGINTFTPFALTLSFTEWIKLTNQWSAGLGASFDFSEYSMFKYNLHVRYFRPHGDYLRGFIDGQVGFAAGGSSFIQNTFEVTDIYISPVFQSSIGAGIFLDSGLGAGFTIEMGMSALRYNLKETFFNGSSESISTSELLKLGPYFQSSFMF